MSIKAELRSGVFYTFIFRYAGIISQIFTSAILARLLTPEEFGVVVAVIVFLSFFTLLSESGIGVAIVQRKDLSDEEIYSLFIITIIIGAFIALIFSFLGPAVSNFYNNEAYNKIIPILAISLFLYSISIVSYAQLFRDKNFRTIGFTNLIVQILSALFAIFLAWKGFGYYALVYQSVFMSGLKVFVGFIASPIKFYRKVDFKVVKKIFSYSFFKLLYDIVEFLSRSTDRILIGKFLGAVPLGYYDKAYKLMAMPVNNLANVISPVLHPVLSSHQNDPQLIYTFYKKLTKLLGIIGLPLSFFLFNNAKEIIIIFFGNQWLGSIQAFQYLSLAVWAQMIFAGSNALFLTFAKTKYMFLSGILYSLIIIIGVVLGIFISKSIEGVAFFLMCALILNLFQVYYLIIVRILKYKLSDFFSSLLKGLLIGIVIFIINLFMNLLLNLDNIIVSISIKLVVSGFAFFIMIKILNEDKNILQLIKRNS